VAQAAVGENTCWGTAIMATTKTKAKRRKKASSRTAASKKPKKSNKKRAPTKKARKAASRPRASKPAKKAATRRAKKKAEPKEKPKKTAPSPAATQSKTPAGAAVVASNVPRSVIDEVVWRTRLREEIKPGQRLYRVDPHNGDISSHRFQAFPDGGQNVSLGPDYADGTPENERPAPSAIQVPAGELWDSEADAQRARAAVRSPKS
jgi:hypothetical protein